MDKCDYNGLIEIIEVEEYNLASNFEILLLESRCVRHNFAAILDEWRVEFIVKKGFLICNSTWWKYICPSNLWGIVSQIINILYIWIIELKYTAWLDSIAYSTSYNIIDTNKKLPMQKKHELTYCAVGIIIK